MSKFKVGEIAITVNCNKIENEGKECEIAKLPSFIKSTLYPDGEFQYMIKIGARDFSSTESHLKKLPPKDTPSSWEDMKDLFIPEIKEVV